jgi:hypothetical protein
VDRFGGGPLRGLTNGEHSVLATLRSTSQEEGHEGRNGNAL